MEIVYDLNEARRAKRSCASSVSEVSSAIHCPQPYIDRNRHVVAY
jgi:hypothetical protein